MAQEMDVVGVREQIKANATLIFPETVADYRALCMRTQQPFGAREAFEIITRIFPGKDGAYFQAILTCDPGGLSTYQVAATGCPATSIYSAMVELLSVLSNDSITEKLEAAHEANSTELLWLNGGLTNPAVR